MSFLAQIIKFWHTGVSHTRAYSKHTNSTLLAINERQHEGYGQRHARLPRPNQPPPSLGPGLSLAKRQSETRAWGLWVTNRTPQVLPHLPGAPHWLSSPGWTPSCLPGLRPQPLHLNSPASHFYPHWAFRLGPGACHFLLPYLTGREHKNGTGWECIREERGGRKTRRVQHPHSLCSGKQDTLTAPIK